MVVNVTSRVDADAKRKKDLSGTVAKQKEAYVNEAVSKIQQQSDANQGLPVRQEGATNNVVNFNNDRNPEYTKNSGSFIDKVINNPEAIDEYKDDTIGEKAGANIGPLSNQALLDRDAQEELKRFNRSGDSIVDRFNKLPNSNLNDGNILIRIPSIIEHNRAGFDLATQIEPDYVKMKIKAPELRASLAPENESIDGTTRANNTSQPLGKILNRFDSIERIPVAGKFKNVIKTDMLAIGLALTEKSFAESVYSDSKAYLKSLNELADNKELTTIEDRQEIFKKIKEFEEKTERGDTTAPMVAKNQGLETLGREIAQEYLVKTGRQDRVGEIDPTEAQHLGGYFKELWSKNHAVDGDNIFLDGVGLVTRHKSTQDGDQVNYQLTSLGVEYLANKNGGSKDVLNILFPPKEVRPSKRPLPQGSLPGMVGEVIREMTGKLGNTESSLEKDWYLKEAMQNLSTIGHKVDTRRNKLLLITAMAALTQLNVRDDSSNPNMWMAEINSLGTKKYVSILTDKKAQDRRRQYAEERGEDFNEPIIDPDEIMGRLKIKASRSLRAIQMEREGLNYLTYSLQGYSGRIAPQQTYFNPTSNKDVRFVTTGAAPVVLKKGSKKDKSLRQMYAMMLLPSIREGAADNANMGAVSDADILLPDAREFHLKANSKQLYNWGERLQVAFDSTLNESEYDQLANAISNDIDFSSEEFPKVNMDLGLDPEVDRSLIDAIKSRGEDGLAFMDGLMDFHNYMNVPEGGQFSTSFNAYIDGKTNGLASNGFQMGHAPTAFATGVIRNGKISLLDGDKDIRDNLQDYNISLLEGVNIGGSRTSNFNDVLTDFIELSRVIFSNRDLNKHTTMTWGYGSELNTFKRSIDGVIDEYQSIYESQQEMNELTPEGLLFLNSLEKLNNIEEVVDARGETHTSSEKKREALVDNIHEIYCEGLQATLSPDVIKARSLVRASALAHTLVDEMMVFKTHSGFELTVGGRESKGLEKGVTESGKYGFDNINGKKNTITQYNYESIQTPQAASSSKKSGEVTWGGALPAPIQSIDGSVVAMTVAGPSWERLTKVKDRPYVHTIYDAFKMDVDSYDVVLAESNKNWMKINENWNYMQQTLDSLNNALKKFTEKTKFNPSDPIPAHTKKYINHLFTPMHDNTKMTTLQHKLLGLDKQLNFLGDDPLNQSKYLVKRLDRLPKRTMKEYNNFVVELARHLQLRKQIQAHINLMNNEKKKIIKMIKEEGYGFNFNGEWIPLQYYAH